MIHYHLHPGEVLKATVLDELEISVTEAAKRLGISRVALSRVVNGKAGISVDLAMRLEAAGVSTARLWLNMQSNYELWLASQSPRPEVMSLYEAPAFA